MRAKSHGENKNKTRRREQTNTTTRTHMTPHREKKLLSRHEFHLFLLEIIWLVSIFFKENTKKKSIEIAQNVWIFLPSVAENL